MVTSSVTMILDSISPEGIRLPSMHLRYWRPIHSELKTHRVFSGNSRSSRAVPVATLLSEEIFIPRFGMNQPGMQSAEGADEEQQDRWDQEWRDLAQITRSYVKRWGDQGMHKQWANRPLEWFGWIDTLVTSTDWENFFALRLDKAAQPELRILAEQMDLCLRSSQPELLYPGQWHLPYIKSHEFQEYTLDELKMISTARCARLSYKPFDGNGDVAAELERYKKLMINRPVHASPAEHQATPDNCYERWDGNVSQKLWEKPELHGNFYGWIQNRKQLPHEAVKDLNR